MIQNFSPREITTLIQSATSKDNVLGQKVNSGGSCRANFKDLLKLIDPSSIPNAVSASYEKLLR
jgi:hypothetical protein